MTSRLPRPSPSLAVWMFAAVTHHGHHRAHHHRHPKYPAGQPPSPADLERVAHLMTLAGLGVAGALVVGALIGEVVHRCTRVRFELLGACLAIPTGVLGLLAQRHGCPPPMLAATAVAGIVAAAATLRAASRHVEDVRLGGDRRRHARARTGAPAWARGRLVRRRAARATPRRGELVVGRTASRLVTLARGGTSGRHVLVVGAPGSGKTTTLAALAQQHIEIAHGRHGVIAIDPKDDPTLASVLRDSAQRAGVRYVEWTPAGPVVYDLLATGDTDRLTDKLLAAEDWTEPHYLAGATTYLREVLRTLHATGARATLSSVLGAMDPDRLEAIAASAGAEHAEVLGGYIEGLSARERADLGGLRNRIAALARSDLAAWLDPDRNQAPVLSLADAVNHQAVVLFRLQADDYPLLSRKVAAAVVLDLIAVAQSHQRDPIPTVALIDEFGAIESDLVIRLLSRARAAGISVLLGTQALADFQAASGQEAMQRRVTANLHALIAHRLNDPDEAEQIAQMIGTQDGWETTQRTSRGLFATVGEGTRTLGREYLVHPDELKTLPRGQAAVVRLDPDRHSKRCDITQITPPRP